MAVDLLNDILAPVLARMKQRVDSLATIKRFARTGIEGWFKVEIVAALGNRVRALKNKGPDLLLEDGTKLELKAATNFSRAWFLEPLRKYGVPCLFLGNGADLAGMTAADTDDFEVVGCEAFSDGSGGEWIVGLVKPGRQANGPSGTEGARK